MLGMVQYWERLVLLFENSKIPSLFDDNADAATSMLAKHWSTFLMSASSRHFAGDSET